MKKNEAEIKAYIANLVELGKFPCTARHETEKEALECSLGEVVRKATVLALSWAVDGDEEYEREVVEGTAEKLAETRKPRPRGRSSEGWKRVRRR